MTDPLTIIRERRSVRSYKSEQPSDAVIRELLQAAVHAPTAMHQEPWGFAIVQDKAVLKRYSERAKGMFAHRDVPVGWGSTAGSRHDHPKLLDDPAFNIFYDAGTLIVVCRRVGGPFTDADCWLAAQNLMLAATAKGLGSCCIGFALGVLNEPDVKHELGIPGDGAAVAAIIVGIPRAPAALVSRRAPQVLRWLK